jgi:hypothetical protein
MSTSRNLQTFQCFPRVAILPERCFETLNPFSDLIAGNFPQTRIGSRDVFLPARRQHRRTLDPLPGPYHRLQISHCAHAVHVYLIRSDHPVDVDQTAIGASRR